MDNVTKNIGFFKQELINKVEQKLPNSTREEDYFQAYNAWIYKFNKEPHRLERESDLQTLKRNHIMVSLLAIAGCCRIYFSSTTEKLVRF